MDVDEAAAIHEPGMAPLLRRFEITSKYHGVNPLAKWRLPVNRF